MNFCPRDAIDALSSSTQNVFDTIMCIWSSLLFLELLILRLLSLSLSALT